MINKDLRLKLYLEGVEFPMKKVTMTSSVNIQTAVTITVPYMKNLSKILTTTHCLITYLTGERETSEQKKEIERIFFEGEITGRAISRNGINRSYTFYATDPRKYLNNMSSQYYHAFNKSALDATNINLYLNSVCTLFDLDGKQAIQEIYKDMTATGNNFKTVGQYYNGILSLLKKSPHGVYQNAMKRYRLDENIAFLDHGKMHDSVDAEKTYSVIMEAVRDFAINSGRTVYDTMIEILNRYGYSFIHLTSPSYFDQESKENNKTPFYQIKKNTTPFFYIVPELLGYDPPTCNIIYTDYDDVFSANLLEPKVTAFRIIPHLNGAVPKSGPTSPQTFPARKQGEKYYEGEDLLCPKRELETEDYFLSSLLVRNSATPKNVEARTREKFYKKKNEDSSISISKAGFYPNLVCGLPAVIYDTVDDVFYHGMINDISFAIDQEEGSVTTQVNLKHACYYDELETKQYYREIEGIQTYYHKMGLTMNFENTPVVSDGEELMQFIKKFKSPDAQPTAYAREIAKLDEYWEGFTDRLKYKTREDNKEASGDRFLITERKEGVSNAKQ